MSLEPLLLLLGVWLVLNLLGAAGRKRRQSARPQPKPGAARKAPTRPRTPAPKPGTVASPGAARADPTQREGSRLEQLLREFGLQLEQAEGVSSGRGPMGRRSGVSLPDAEEVEEVESLEQEPEIQSLETYAGRPERELVVQDDQAEAVVQRRLAWAEKQARPLTRADHQAFDRRIRAAPESPLPAAPSGVPSDRATRLRQAMVLREVLGPPTGLRVD